MTDEFLPKPGDRFDPERQRHVLRKVAEGLAARRLTAPAIFVLESGMPLTYVASQALVLLRPFVQAIVGIQDYEVFAAAVEDRKNVEWLIQQLEAAEEKRTNRVGRASRSTPSQAADISESSETLDLRDQTEDN